MVDATLSCSTLLCRLFAKFLVIFYVVMLLLFFLLLLYLFHPLQFLSHSINMNALWVLDGVIFIVAAMYLLSSVEKCTSLLV